MRRRGERRKSPERLQAQGKSLLLSFNATDGGLTKNGGGKLTLGATSTYTGATTVNGGTLAGVGTVGNLAVGSGGTLTPGISAGILNTGNTDLLLGSTFGIELNGTTAGTGYDQLNSSMRVVRTIRSVTPATTTPQLHRRQRRRVGGRARIADLLPRRDRDAGTAASSEGGLSVCERSVFPPKRAPDTRSVFPFAAQPLWECARASPLFVRSRP